VEGEEGTGDVLQEITWHGLVVD